MLQLLVCCKAKGNVITCSVGHKSSSFAAQQTACSWARLPETSIQSWSLWQAGRVTLHHGGQAYICLLQSTDVAWHKWQKPLSLHTLRLPCMPCCRHISLLLRPSRAFAACPALGCHLHWQLQHGMCAALASPYLQQARQFSYLRAPCCLTGHGHEWLPWCHGCPLGTSPRPTSPVSRP